MFVWLHFLFIHNKIKSYLSYYIGGSQKMQIFKHSFFLLYLYGVTLYVFAVVFTLITANIWRN